MHPLVSASLIASGIIHLLPLSGVTGSNQLSRLYGIPIKDPNLIILMRHRAVLFGLLGAFHCYAAFKPEFVDLAFGSGFISVISFLMFCMPNSVSGGYNRQIGRVFKADVIALACLSVGALINYWN